MELLDDKLAFCSFKYKPKNLRNHGNVSRNNIHTSSTILREYQVTPHPRRFHVDYSYSHHHLKRESYGFSRKSNSNVSCMFRTDECRIGYEVPHFHSRAFFILYSSNFSFDDESSMGNASGNNGVYIDLGQILETLDDSNGHEEDAIMNTQTDDASNDDSNSSSSSSSSSSENIEKWRSRHWIVLIDDEPAIRLAVGDYLHSMGYNVVTACDGPLAFLEMLIWSLAWSSSLKVHANGESGDHEMRDNHNIIARPPWIDTHENDADDVALTRLLPNCIISDIRMPGFIDGVELLELMRLGMNSTLLESTVVNFAENVDDNRKEPDVGRTKKKTRKQKHKKKEKSKKKNDKQFSSADDSVGFFFDDDDDDDDEDDFIFDETIETLASESTALSPTDQAIHYINKIYTLISFLLQHECQDSENATNQNQISEIENEMDQISFPYYPYNLKQIPFILLTAKAMVSDRIRGYNAGADAYLPKPFRPEELVGMLDNLMRRQAREREVDFLRKRQRDRNVEKSDYLTSSELNMITKKLRKIKHILQSNLNDT
ncbi:hypothetical protein ACHAXS_014226 [Conticribra weissflogii]